MLAEFWIKYELEDGVIEWEGPYGLEIVGDMVAYDLLANVSEVTVVTTCCRVFKEGVVVEMIPLLVRRRRNERIGAT